MNWIIKKISEDIIKIISDWLDKREEKLEQRIKKLIQEESYSWLPQGMCWLCSNPLSRCGGSYTWRGRMFCNSQCLEKFAQIINNPDESYKIVNGDPVYVVNPSTGGKKEIHV